MQFDHGDTVQHRVWGTTGTVHLFEGAAADEVQGEVRWHGTGVADELDLIAAQLTKV